MNATRRTFVAAVAILSALLTMAVLDAPAQMPLPSADSAGKVDPALARSRDVELLTGRIRDEFLRGNLEQARTLCKQALQIDPENNTARLFLSMAERRLKSGVEGSTDSAVSALPKSPYMHTAVEMSRPTTPTALMPSTHPQSALPEPGPTPRPAAVGGTTPSTASTPFGFGDEVLQWAIVVLLVLVGGLIVVMVIDRLFAGRRQRAAQAQFFDHMRVATEGAVQTSAAEGAEAPAPDDDFPIGISVPVEAPEAAQEPPSFDADAADGDILTYWDEGDRRAEVATGDRPMAEAAVVDDDSGAISAEEAFAGGLPEFAYDRAAPAEEPASEEEFSPFDVSEPESEFPADAGERPIDISELDEAPVQAAAREEFEEDEEEVEERPPAPFLVTTEPEDAAPLVIEGFEFETPSPDMTEADEPDDAENVRRSLRKEAVLEDDVVLAAEPAGEDSDAALDPELDLMDLDDGEDAPLALDTRLGDTQTATGHRRASEPEPLPRMSETAPIAPGGWPSDDVKDSDDPPSLLAETVILAPKDAPLRPDAPAAPTLPEDMDLPLDDPSAKFDEILITGSGPSRRAEATEPIQPDAGDEMTMVDGKARHKAVFQDQLARGLAAMDAGEWKDAVKFLAVAHAMDPTDNYARGKLREARDRQPKAERRGGG